MHNITSREELLMKLAKDLFDNDLLNLSDYSGDVGSLLFDVVKTINSTLDDYEIVEGNVLR